jgi:hypothetical protein
MVNYTPIYTSVAAVQAVTGLSNTDVDLSTDANVRAIIETAEQELESLCQRKFTNANDVTEYFSTRGADIIGNYTTSVLLSHFPIQEIVSFDLLDVNGTAYQSLTALSDTDIAAGIFQSQDYWLESSNDPMTNTAVPSGKIVLKVYTIPQGTNTAKVSYTYGYTSVPVQVADLAACLAGMRLWLRFLGGNYNFLNSYSIPQQSVSKGDLYQRGKDNIELLQKKANDLLGIIGRRNLTMLLATGANR